MALVLQRQTVSSKRRAASCLAVVIAAVLAGCGRASSREPPVVSPTTANIDDGRGTAPHGERATPEDIALRWLNALRDHDESSLKALSAFPFHFKTTAATTRCADRASTQDQLRALADCIIADELFLRELKQTTDFHISRLTRETLPTWATATAVESIDAYTEIKAFINGNGVTYVFLMLVTAAQVDTFIQHTEFEQG
jgi:hypothetical protein